MKKLYAGHPDYKVLPVKYGLSLVWDELVEYRKHPSRDELSDIAYAINRTIGGIFKKKYIRAIPFDSIHIKKANNRWLSYGHFRSKRHL